MSVEEFVSGAVIRMQVVLGALIVVATSLALLPHPKRASALVAAGMVVAPCFAGLWYVTTRLPASLTRALGGGMERQKAEARQPPSRGVARHDAAFKIIMRVGFLACLAALVDQVAHRAVGGAILCAGCTLVFALLVFADRIIRATTARFEPSGALRPRTPSP